MSKDRLELGKLSEYLNKYAQKLCRDNSAEGESVKLDELQFTRLTKEVSKAAFDPYLHLNSDRTLAK